MQRMLEAAGCVLSRAAPMNSPIEYLLPKSARQRQLTDVTTFYGQQRREGAPDSRSLFKQSAIHEEC